uniref:Uncharacterized protein n=1 Tax=Anguilla anguilla TaxID=7936 RepID=A0A0E9SBW4_ANGAN
MTETSSNLQHTKS